ncbi:hypothetical protein [Nocardia macrotermitis]|uniref:hypothetical protein n=1 Tax=Nocardia macrotermitis TaxID=2585198 RepID=UPI0012952801|nr:hypothetical protein [Nocardia macrotermitis]
MLLPNLFHLSALIVSSLALFSAPVEFGATWWSAGELIHGGAPARPDAEPGGVVSDELLRKASDGPV